MKKLFIVANWKSNKTAAESEDWLQKVLSIKYQVSSTQDKEIIICPSFTLLQEISIFVKNNSLPLKLGTQNISPFDEGAYTGEVNAKQVKEFAEYVIIGHSERRQNFLETDAMLAEKVKLAINAGLKPIFCVQGKDTPVPEGAEIVAYEPVFAIGSGHPDTPENADSLVKAIKEIHHSVKYVLYGGSVTPENVKNFTQMEHISGALVGGASLDPYKFMQIIENS